MRALDLPKNGVDCVLGSIDFGGFILLSLLVGVLFCLSAIFSKMARMARALANFIFAMLLDLLLLGM